jgi:hypothetical protein
MGSGDSSREEAPRRPGGRTKKLLALARAYCGEGTCPIHRGNAALWQLLIAASRQWRLYNAGVQGVVLSQIYGLDMATISAMAPAYGLKQNQIFFEKLHIFEAACLNIWNPQGCTEKKKKDCEAQHGEFLEWSCSVCPDNPKSIKN